METAKEECIMDFGRCFRANNKQSTELAELTLSGCCTPFDAFQPYPPHPSSYAHGPLFSIIGLACRRGSWRQPLPGWIRVFLARTIHMALSQSLVTSKSIGQSSCSPSKAFEITIPEGIPILDTPIIWYKIIVFVWLYSYNPYEMASYPMKNSH